MKLQQLERSSPIYIESTGSGPDMVLLHGWGMHGGYWADMVDELAQQFRVHCVDLPGHGHSAYQGEQAIDDYVEVIKQALPDNIKFPAVFIGWSLGGLIAQALTHAHPELVSRLLLIASTPSFVQRERWSCATSAEVLQGFADNLVRDYRTTLNRFLALQVRGSEQQQHSLRELRARLFERGEPQHAGLQAGLSLLRDVDLREALFAINKPIALLGGERDTLVPQQALLDIAENLSNAGVEIISKAGHAPFLSHPDQCIHYIKQFCQS